MGLAARLVITVVALAIALLCPPPAFSQHATNIILLIGDGMGFEQIKAGACFKGTNLCFEEWAHQGEATTHSASSAVTDSAAAGTALATGHKVNNGVLSVAVPGDGHEYETVLEQAKRKGKRTGLVTTTSMTDATPAAFGAHDGSRRHYSDIAADYFQQTKPNVLFGGGGDMRVFEAVAAGYTVVTSRAGMRALDPSKETMVSGQFGPANMPYEHSGVGSLPHLSEMTEAALRILERGTNGFFLMVEGGRIDHACHVNDITNCVRETLEFDNAVRVVVNWAGSRADTLMIVTADHECGGLKVLEDKGPGREPRVSWSSGGHTGTNVGVFARGPGAELVAGVMDNTDIYRVMTRMQPIVPEAVGIGPLPAEGMGTFTGAGKDKPGRFALAEGGTVFLDEIGDISPAMQIRLLRVVQERTYEPLGGTQTRRADVRIIAATHRDLAALIRKGSFREDLFYRLNVVKLAPAPAGDTIAEQTRAAEAQAIRAAMERCHGNRLAAARALGLHKSTLFRKIRALGNDLPEKDGRAGG